MLIWIVRVEYECGSDNGEVCEILSAHRTEKAAEAAAEAWKKDHDCPWAGWEANEEEEEEDWDWCPGCSWGPSVSNLTMEDEDL